MTFEKEDIIKINLLLKREEERKAEEARRELADFFDRLSGRNPDGFYPASPWLSECYGSCSNTCTSVAGPECVCQGGCNYNLTFG